MGLSTPKLASHISKVRRTQLFVGLSGTTKGCTLSSQCERRTRSLWAAHTIPRAAMAIPPLPPEPSWTRGCQRDLGPEGCVPRESGLLPPAPRALPAQLGEEAAGKPQMVCVPKLDDASEQVRSQISASLCHTETFPVSPAHI